MTLRRRVCEQQLKGGQCKHEYAFINLLRQLRVAFALCTARDANHAIQRCRSTAGFDPYN